MPAADLIAQLNSSLIGRYAIEREIGMGGMATVFLAEDLKHKRKVALKVLRPELAAMLGGERFVQEIATTASLQHPHLLPLFDSGEAGGQLYYVMPFMEGETLRERMRRETMLPVDDALRITAAVASALHYAHRHGVVHRDLKPENILINEGEPVVSDFGIALAVSRAGGMRMTQTGMSLGTPQYMSPEQATGDRQIDARTDVYSLAAVLYEMLTGDPPHTGHNAQAVVAKVITERPRGLRETRDAVPPHVEVAVMRALAKLPADRFASAAEFAAAIAPRGESLAAMPNERTVGAAPARVPLSRAAALTAARRWGLPTVALVGAALLGSVLMASRQAPAPVQPLRFDIHWTEPNRPSATAPGNLAMSRDGTRLVRTLAGRAGIYSRPMDGLSWTLIPGTDSATATAPTFSPDGKFLLYSTRSSASSNRENYLLMRMPVDGGAAVQIADSVDSDGYTWGDRDRVAFLRHGALWTVSALGDTPRLLAKPDTARHQLRFATASFLPEGDAVLASIIHGSRAGANASDLDSAYIGAVSVGQGKVTDLGVRGVGAKYSLGHLVYTDASGTLIALPFDAKRLRITGPPTKLAEGALVNVVANDMLVSDNGWILYVPKTRSGTENAAGYGNFGLERVTRPSTVHAMNVQEQTYLAMSISPDGERIALCVVSAGGSWDIWILQLATGHLNPLTRDGKNCFPVWTRDGKRVAYRVGSWLLFQPGNWFSVPWDLSGAPEPVLGTDGAIEYEPGPPGGYFATVRPDSSATASTGVVTRGDIWIAPVDTPTARRPFAATAAGEWAPRLSPDGKWMAYMLFEPGVAGQSPPKIYARPVPGPGAVIPISGALGVDPRWGRDDATLYYLAGRNGYTVARLALGGANPVLRTEGAFTAGGTSDPVWHGYGILPDGDIIDFSAARAQVAAPRAAPAPPPNPIAIFGWLNLVKGSAKSSAPAP